MANPGLPEVIATEAAQATTEVDAAGAKHLEPSLWGLEPYQWVSVSMFVLILVAIFGAKVHKTIAAGLDGKIAAIKEQLARIVDLGEGHTVLVSHNIDLAPYVDLDAGDRVVFRGRYEWNDRGGVVHWTHHDPRGRGPGGWITVDGKTYR